MDAACMQVVYETMALFGLSGLVAGFVAGALVGSRRTAMRIVELNRKAGTITLAQPSDVANFEVGQKVEKR